MTAKYKSVAIIGGDERQLYCADAFFEDGLKVTLGGFDTVTDDCDFEICSPLEAALCSEFIILPLPAIKENKVNAPLSKTEVSLNPALMSAIAGKKVFCGMKNKLLSVYPALNGELIFDYSAREEFAVKNALLTAEGAIEIALREYKGTIQGSRCLVCGYGRIGKMLSDRLCMLGADVTVSARKSSDFAWIEALRCKSIKTTELEKSREFDIIFNTVPAMIFDSRLLSHIARNALVIDLASVPGGVDFSAASRLGINAVHALSLPGRCAPKSAGRIIKNTITNMLEEDDR